MKVSIVILMVLVACAVALPSQKWDNGGGNGQQGVGLISGLSGLLHHVLQALSKLLGGINVGVLLDTLPKQPGNSRLNSMLQANNGDWNAVVESEGGQQALVQSIVQLILSKGGDLNTVTNILGILGKDKGALNAIEKKILSHVKELLKDGGTQTITQIKRLIGKLSKGQTESSSKESGRPSKEGSDNSASEGSDSSSGESGGSAWGKNKEHGGSLDVKRKTKILRLIKSKILAKIGGSKGGIKGVIRKEAEKIKTTIFKKIEKEILKKRKSGVELNESELLRKCKRISEEELEKYDSSLNKIRGGKKGSSSSSSQTIDVSVRKEITKITEKRLVEELKQSGILEEKEKLSSEELTKCKEVITKKVEEEIREKQKGGTRLKKSEIKRIIEEVVKKEAQSETIISIVRGGKKGSSSSSETTSVSIKEEVTKVTEEKLTQVLKESGVLKEGKETLTSEELTKCKEVIIKKVEEEIREKEKNGKKLEKSEIKRITEEVIKKEAQSETIISIVSGGKGGSSSSSSSETISVATKEEISKVTEEKLTQVLKESGVLKDGKETLTSEELTKCKEVITKKVEEEIREKEKSGKKLEKSEIKQITEEVIKKEAQSETIISIVSGGKKGSSSSSETISVATKEEISKVTEEKLTQVLKESGVLKDGKETLTSEELTKCKEVITKKVEEEIREKQKSGKKLEISEIKQLTEEVIKKEAQSETIISIVSGGKGGSSSSSSETISVATKEEISKVTEEKLTQVLKESGVLKEGEEKLSSEQLTQCKEVILKKVEEEIHEKQKSGSKLEQSEIRRLTEEVIKKEAKSESILQIVKGSASQDEVVDAGLWEKITEVTKEKLKAEVEKAKSSGKIEEELSLTELQKCSQRILKVVKEELREVKKSGKKLEESKVLKKVEEIIQREVHESNLLVEVHNETKAEKSESQSSSEKKGE
nr:PREDICTED: centrosomal protein of 83 kDa-like [Megachile rotundata]